MDAKFYKENRSALYRNLKPSSMVLIFSGEELRKTNDEDYPFFANRNFVYLTGVEQKESILWGQVTETGDIKETLFLLPPDKMKERWTGRRLTMPEAEAVSGVADYAFLEAFQPMLEQTLSQRQVDTVYLDIDESTIGGNVRYPARSIQSYIEETYPDIKIDSARAILKTLRTIKKPCEIEALKKAEEITREGILAMMEHSKPGMYEYQYKAYYDFVLAQHGLLESGFPSIISGGKNNFCIHYYSYMGQVCDGDMVLNDVGVNYDHVTTDVSRGWPCNGKYSDKQKLLYECAYNTSEYMFRTVKPGIPAMDIDKMIKSYNCRQLMEAGVLKNADDIDTYMWHGGAHHIGFDVHDVVDVKGRLTEPGMVFCIDVGIYHEEWGIGFRLEDNCLVTEDGCVNLSADIPRRWQDIEEIMK